MAKTLVWVNNEAVTPFGTYRVFNATERGLGWVFVTPNGIEKCFRTSEKHAKRSAQIDFHFRVDRCS